MKIIHIVEASATGTLAMLSLLASAQARQGDTVEVVYSRRDETPDNLEDHFDSGVKLIQIQMNSVADKIRSIGLIRKTLRSSSPDSVYMHSSFAGFLGRLAGLSLLPNTSFYTFPTVFLL